MTTDKPVSPMRVAEELIFNHTATLRDGIATLLRSRAKEYLALAHRENAKSRQIDKMEEDEDYVPISARVAFKLQAMKEVEELQGFKELQESVNEFMSTVQDGLKDCIIECAKLEQKYLRERKVSTLIHAIKDTVSIIATAHEINANKYGKIGCAIIEAHGDTITMHLDIDKDAFLAKFRAELNVTAPTSALSGNISLIVPQIRQTIEAIYIRPWDRYLATLKQQDIDLTLKKKAKEAMTMKATEATAMEVDKEISIDPKQLKELIAEQAKLELKRMLRDTAKPKPKGDGKDGKKPGNDKRGKKPSASQKKKKGQDKKQPADGNQGGPKSASRDGKKPGNAANSNRSSQARKKGRPKGSQRS